MLDSGEISFPQVKRMEKCVSNRASQLLRLQAPPTFYCGADPPENKAHGQMKYSIRLQGETTKVEIDENLQAMERKFD